MVITSMLGLELGEPVVGMEVSPLEDLFELGTRFLVMDRGSNRSSPD